MSPYSNGLQMRILKINYLCLGRCLPLNITCILYRGVKRRMSRPKIGPAQYMPHRASTRSQTLEFLVVIVAKKRKRDRVSVELASIMNTDRPEEMGPNSDQCGETNFLTREKNSLIIIPSLKSFS
jgi:hypothetical protein